MVHLSHSSFILVCFSLSDLKELMQYLDVCMCRWLCMFASGLLKSLPCVSVFFFVLGDFMASEIMV